MSNQSPFAAGGITEKPSLETVKTVIDTILSADANANRKQASDWLDALKLSVHAWEICDQLLALNSSIEVSYIAAHMLRGKISSNFNELPLEYYQSLKDSLLIHLSKHDDYAVQGQLTAAIADLTLLLAQWTNPIEDLAQNLNLHVSLSTIDRTKQDEIHKALNQRLIFANIIHQMCDLNHNHSERPCKIGANRREAFEDYLISKCNQCVEWWVSTLGDCTALRADLVNLENSLRNSSTDQIQKIVMNIHQVDRLIGEIYLCYSAWLRIFDEENVMNSNSLIGSAFNRLADVECTEKLHAYAVECIISTANYCEDSTRIDYLTEQLVEMVYKSENAFMHSVVNEDVEKSSGYVRIFTSVAITACKSHVIDKKDFKLIELLLSCLSHYDFDIVEETFTFWYCLIENIQNYSNPTEFAPYVGYINRFIIALTKLCQCDPDCDSIIKSDFDIERFRFSASEVITHILYVTSVSEFLQTNQILVNLNLDLRQVSWERVEAILFLLSVLVQLMTKEEDNIKREILNNMILQQTFSKDLNSLLSTKQVNIKIGIDSGQIHPQIVSISLKLISLMDDFLERDDVYLGLSMNYILASISNPKDRALLMKDAAEALCRIVQTQASRHFASNQGLLAILKDLCLNLDSYDPGAASLLLKCCSCLSNSIEDLNTKEQFLGQILQPNIISLMTTLALPKDSDEEIPLKHLDRISVIFQHAALKPKDIVEMKTMISLIDTLLWPTLVNVLEHYASTYESVIEKCCRTIRYLLRCLKPQWMIQSVAETMVDLYRNYPQNSSPLYVCSILVDEFANVSPEINQGLYNVLDAFCNMTFTLLDVNGPQAKSLLSMKTYPETIEDMMRLFNRFMKKCPAEFVNCKAIESIIELSISSLRIDHSDANGTVCKFLTSFIQLGIKNQQSHDQTLQQQQQQQQQQHQHQQQQEHQQTHGDQNQLYYPRIRDAIRNVLGARIVDAVIKACLFHLPTSLIGDEATILMMLSAFDKDLFKKWIEETVSSLPTTNIQGIVSITPDQLDDFKSTITTATSLKKMINCIRAFANLYN